MPLPEPDLLRLAATAYEAAGDPAAWPDFLRMYADTIGADITLIQRHYLSEHRSELVATFGMAQRFTDAYNQYYSRLNVWRENGRNLYEEGRVVFDEELYPRALLKQTEFYNDLLLPNLGTHSIAGVISRHPNEVVVLTGLRHDRREPFESTAAITISTLLPHVIRARAAEERFRVLDAGPAVLNALRSGMFLLAADGQVIFSNRSGENMLRAADGLTLRANRIAAASADANAALQMVIRAAISPVGTMPCPAGVLLIRPSGKRPYHVTAAPLRRVAKAFLAMKVPSAMVVVTDPERPQSLPSDALRQGYGLTNREATIAIALAEGYTLEQTAGHLGMRYETARTHLRRILSKTRTSRQTELALLITRILQPSIYVD